MANVPDPAAVAQQLADANSLITGLQAQVAALEAARTQAQNSQTFAITPGLVNVEDVIQFGTKKGDYIYSSAVEALPSKFDMKSGQTVVFVEELTYRAKDMGWSVGTKSITIFDVSATATHDLKDLFTQYGQITATAMQTRCENWMKVGGSMYQSRATQNNQMMQKCILNSLTEDAKRRLSVHRASYTFDGEVYAPLLFKIIMKLATVDSKATTEKLRDQLNHLDVYAASKCDNDLEKLHEFFDVNYTQLIGRGESIDDPIAILFKAYKGMQDRTFNAYIEQKKNDYFEE